MTCRCAASPRFTITPRAYFWVAVSALVVCTLIVFTGAAVRLTGSGLGCPDWPRCQGTRLTPELSTHAVIEFGNRLLTGVVGLPCLAAAILAWFRRPFRRDLALIALLLPLGVLAQAVLGGMTVWYGLKPGWVIGHFLLSMLLLVACVVLVWRAAHEPADGAAARATGSASGRCAALVVLGALTLGARHDRDGRRPARGRRGHRRRSCRGSTGRAPTRSTGRSTSTGSSRRCSASPRSGRWFLLRARKANDMTQQRDDDGLRAARLPGASSAPRSTRWSCRPAWSGSTSCSPCSPGWRCCGRRSPSAAASPTFEPPPPGDLVGDAEPPLVRS